MKLTLLGGLYLLRRFIRNVGEKWNFVLRYGPGGRYHLLSGAAAASAAAVFRRRRHASREGDAMM